MHCIVVWGNRHNALRLCVLLVRRDKSHRYATLFLIRLSSQLFLYTLHALLSSLFSLLFQPPTHILLSFFVLRIKDSPPKPPITAI